MVKLENRLLSHTFKNVLERLSASDGGYFAALVSNNEYDFTEGTARNFTLRKDATVSFLPKGKPCEVIKHGKKNKWARKCRQVTTLGKGLKMMFELIGYTLSDFDIEKRVNMIKAEIAGADMTEKSKDNFQVVSGHEIRFWYRSENADADALHSCMSYPKCSLQMNVYADNPHVCKMLILRSENDPKKIVGRALLWRTTQGLMMDRVYAPQQLHYKFFAWAKDNGYCRKHEQTRTNDTMVHPTTGRMIHSDNKGFVVKGVKFRLEHRHVMPVAEKFNPLPPEDSELYNNFSFPYIDTFCYIYPALGELRTRGAEQIHLYGSSQNNSWPTNVGSPGVWSDELQSFVNGSWVVMALNAGGLQVRMAKSDCDYDMYSGAYFAKGISELDYMGRRFAKSRLRTCAVTGKLAESGEMHICEVSGKRFIGSLVPHFTIYQRIAVKYGYVLPDRVNEWLEQHPDYELLASSTEIIKKSALKAEALAEEIDADEEEVLVPRKPLLKMRKPAFEI